MARTTVFVFCLLCTIMMTGAVDTLSDAMSPECADKVEQARQQCDRSNSEHNQKAKDACGTADYAQRMKRVAKLQKIAKKQSKAIAAAGKAMKSAKAHASTIADESGKERKHLLSLLAKQKKRQATLKDAKKKEKIETKNIHNLKRQADEATEAAVKLARDSDNTKQVTQAKQKAHQLYQRYIDYEVKVASVQREVKMAHVALEEISAQVETEIANAKATADKEAAALKEVAQQKMNAANAKKIQAVMEEKASSKAVSAAADTVHLLKGKMKEAASDKKYTKANLKKASAMLNKAQNAELNATVAAKVYDLQMAKLQKEAAAQAAGLSSKYPHNKKQQPVPHKDLHQHYANKVKEIEKARAKAAVVHRKALEEVSSLAQKGVSGDKMVRAKQDVKTAAQTMEKLVAEQNAAVAKVVNHIKNSPK